MASEAEQRAAGGGYTDAEFNEAMLRSQRSDPLTVAIRLGTLVAVYWLLARAIAQFKLPVSLLWLPLAAEFLAILWIGRFAIKPFVDCKAFARSMGGWFAFLFWNGVVVGAYVAALGIDYLESGNQYLRHLAIIKGRGGELDLEKASGILINDYRSGTLGRITLETPELRAARLAELKEANKTALSAVDPAEDQNL